jgi:hypothetical protein
VPRRIGDEFAENDRQRIGLLAGGAASRQKPQPAARRIGPHARGHHHLGEGAELIVVAEEIRLADGQLLRQLAQFARIAAALETGQVGIRPDLARLDAALEHLAEKAELALVEIEADLAHHGLAKAIDRQRGGRVDHAIAAPHRAGCRGPDAPRSEP